MASYHPYLVLALKYWLVELVLPFYLSHHRLVCTDHDQGLIDASECMVPSYGMVKVPIDSEYVPNSSLRLPVMSWVKKKSKFITTGWAEL